MSDAADPVQSQRVVGRLGWLHFANDFTLDFITPLLPAGVGVAWLGIMEGVADGIGQVLKLFTGRASDRTGRRTPWVRGGYLVNACARPLSAVGMLLAWPWWIVACRIGDRVGKGLRGSATDALVADWTEGPRRSLAFNRMRSMDHLGATLGGLAAALAAWALAPGDLWMAVAALALVAGWVAWLARGLADRPLAVAAGSAPSPAWWPGAGPVRRPLLAMGLASMGTRLAPLLVLVQVAGLPAEGSSARWPLWLVCLAWAAFGLVQAAAAGFAGVVSARLGPAWMLRSGWLATVLVLVGLAFAQGPWLIAVGIAFGIIGGLTEGAEKSLLADLVPKAERGVAFGALALLTAVLGLLGNAVAGLLLEQGWPPVFALLAAAPLAALLVLPRRRT